MNRPKKVYEYFEEALEGYVFPDTFDYDDEAADDETNRCETCHIDLNQVNGAVCINPRCPFFVS